MTSEYERQADAAERELADMEQRSEQLGDQIDDARQDWESKQADSKVPGAAGDPERAEEGGEHPETAVIAKGPSDEVIGRGSRRTTTAGRTHGADEDARRGGRADDDSGRGAQRRRDREERRRGARRRRRSRGFRGRGRRGAIERRRRRGERATAGDEDSREATGS